MAKEEIEMSVSVIEDRLYDCEAWIEELESTITALGNRLEPVSRRNKTDDGMLKVPDMIEDNSEVAKSINELSRKIANKVNALRIIEQNLEV